MRNEGVRVVLDPEIDRGGWPGVLAGRTAAVGEMWLGPMGMLGRLEVELGLGGAWATEVERVADFARKLRGRDGYWTRSFEADGLATSRRLLADRDGLMMAGWEGQAASARLAALWQVTDDALDGVPVRMRRVIGRLRRGALDVESIAIVEPMDALPPLWRTLVGAVAATGVRVEHTPLARAGATGDLAGAREARFAPVGDGTITLLRPHGALAAAEEVAAALAAMDRLDGVVVLGPEGELDAALVRHGLPPVGGDQAAPGCAALVRLVLETAFAPMDPADLHALLCADPGPVPRSLARRLVRALASLPGRGAPFWKEALARGLADLDEARRPRVAERLAALVDPIIERSAPIAVGAVGTRLRALATWARGRIEREPSLAAVVELAEAVTFLVARTGALQLTRTELRRLCDEVEDQARGGVAGAGLGGVARPGAMLGPADVVIWWGFTRAQAPGVQRVRLSEAERGRLAELGVAPPDPGALMAAQARRWRRPLELARRALVLVCPLTSDTGEPEHPHPLWDEITARMTDGRLVARLIARELALPARARREAVALRPLPAARDAVRVARSLAFRDPESPSSLEQLLGCSLAWALNYHGGLRSGLAAGPSGPSPILLGNIAHHVMAEVFRGGPLAPDEAATRADTFLDRELASLCEALGLADHQVEQAMVRRGIVESAREVARLIADLGAEVRGVEFPVAGSVGTLRIAGDVDLLLAGPDVVIDLKWGGSTNRKRLESGCAFQLAAYAAMCGSGRKRPKVAYFILRTQQLLAEPGTKLPGAVSPGTATAAETWAGALAAIDARRAELARGELVAPGAIAEPDESVLDGGLLKLAPACEYCDLDTLCGRGGCS